MPCSYCCPLLFELGCLKIDVRCDVGRPGYLLAAHYVCRVNRPWVPCFEFQVLGYSVLKVLGFLVLKVLRSRLELRLCVICVRSCCYFVWVLPRLVGSGFFLASGTNSSPYIILYVFHVNMSM